MSLPSSGIRWKEYRNITPTFNLTPVEKPDFSPFLIHMTGKNSLVKILKGENAPEGIDVPEKNGFLKSVIPSFEGQEAIYNSEVVCFTESPVFAIDFFRYRSYRRWATDQRYGIGFSKSDLILKRGVKPVIYLDSKTNSQLLNLCNKIIGEDYQIVDKEGEIIEQSDLFKNIKPLLFPLLENTTAQGFMWEREWRYPDKSGLIFPHTGIKVICCPKSEKDEIREILGDVTDRVEIVESWKEYDDVTNYLKRREQEVNNEQLSSIDQIHDFAVLVELKNQNEQTVNTLQGYCDIFKDTASSLEERNVQELITEMQKKTSEINIQLEVVKEEIRKQKEAEKQKKNK